jgi:SAM-dependent methyltransferase/ribosomal protein L32
MRSIGISGTVRARTRKAKRIAKGLADPDSRGAYLEEARRRLRREERLKRPERDPESGRPRCLICGSGRLRERQVTYTRDASKSCDVRICKACGYVHMPGHVESRYQGKTEMEQLPEGHSRLGTIDVPGREFHMAKMAVDILGGSRHDVLLYGAGRSLDNHHMAKLPEIRRVAIGDIMKVRDDAEFIDANNPPRKRFSVVVASEVIEHFRNPHEDFAKLFRLVKHDGLLVCGTNIYDGGPLAADRYIFYPDHTSYYTPQVLRRIANQAGIHIDFRSPLVGQGMRKRYVLFSRSADVMENVAVYFGTEVYAPSELAQPERPLPQHSHQAWREPAS